MAKLEARLASVKETFQFGQRLGAAVAPRAVVGLIGELGAGKTAMVRGLASGLDVKNADTVHSPTFTLINTYGGDIPLVHIDLYRLNGLDDLESIGFSDVLTTIDTGDKGVVAIEWVDKFPIPLPLETFFVTIRYSLPQSETRNVVVERKDLEASSQEWQSLVKRLEP